MSYIDDIQLMLYALKQNGDWTPDLENPDYSKIKEVLQKTLPNLDVDDPDWLYNASQKLAAKASVDIEARGFLLNSGTAQRTLEVDTQDALSKPMFNDAEAHYIKEMLIALNPESEDILKDSHGHDALLDRVLGRFLEKADNMPENPSLADIVSNEILQSIKSKAEAGDTNGLVNTHLTDLKKALYGNDEALQRLEEDSPEIHAWVLRDFENRPFIYEEASLQDSNAPDIGTKTKIADVGDLSRGFQVAAFDSDNAPEAPEIASDLTQKLIT